MYFALRKQMKSRFAQVQWVKTPFRWLYVLLPGDMWPFGHNKAAIIPIIMEWQWEPSI